MPTPIDDLSIRVSKVETEFNAFREVVYSKFDALMSKEQIAQLIAVTASGLIDQTVREQWTAVDQEYQRISGLVSDITSKYGELEFSAQRVDALGREVKRLADLQEARGKQIEESTKATNEMNELYAAGYIAIFGRDPRKPGAPKMEGVVSIMDQIKEDREENKLALNESRAANVKVSDMETVLAGFTGQFTGENGLFADMRQTRADVERIERVYEMQGEALKAFISVFKSKVFKIGFTMLFGGGATLAIFGEQLKQLFGG